MGLIRTIFLILGAGLLVDIGSGQVNPPPSIPLPRSPEREPSNGTSKLPTPAILPDGARELTRDRFLGSLFDRWWNDHRWRWVTARPRIATGTSPAFLSDEQWRNEQRDSWRNDCVERLIPLLQHHDQRVRAATIFALGRLGWLQPPTLQEALSGEPEQVVTCALLTTAMTHGSPHTYSLLQLASGKVPTNFAKPQHDQWQEATWLFLGLRRERLLAPMRSMILQPSRSPESRAVGILAQALDGDSQIVPPLLELAGNPREHTLVRCAALEGLAILGEPTSAEAIVQLLCRRESAAEIRAGAAIALATTLDSVDRSLIRSVLRHLERESNLTVRQLLMVSLGEIPGTDVELVLSSQLQSQRDTTRAFAAVALGILAQTPNDGVMELLESSLLECRSVPERTGLLAALGLSRDARAGPLLLEEIQRDQAPSVRRIAAEALAVSGNAQCISGLLQELAQETNPQVLEALAITSGLLAPNATASLLRLLHTKSAAPKLQRIPLLAALGESKDPQALPILLELLASPATTGEELSAAIFAIARIYDARPYRPLSPLGFYRNYLRENLTVSRLVAQMPTSLR